MTPRAVPAPEATHVTSLDPTAGQRTADGAADELTDAELETVVGGLARSYIVPVAPLSRRPI